MSHVTYDEEWKKAQELLTQTINYEQAPGNRRQQRKSLATLYVKYIIVANKLSECVDQMVQPQKRALIRKLLEATLGRIIELKWDLIEADLNEWSHVGDVISELNVTPYQSELKIPKCFTDERREEIEYKEKFIEDVLEKYGFSEKVEEKKPMSEQQAILIIQTHERARQGRLRAQFMKEVRNMKEKSKPLSGDGKENEEEFKQSISLPAAMRIQKVWRGYQTRRQTRRRKLEEMLLIGMIPPPKQQNEEITKAIEVEKYRRSLQKTRQKEYEVAVVNYRNYIEKHQRAIVLEQLSDEIRIWLHEYKAQTGKIPEYTGSDRGSSRLLLSRQGTDSEISKSTQGSSKESKPKKSKSAKSKDDKSDDEEDETYSKAIVSTFLPSITMHNEEYDEIWKNKNESSNPRQIPYKDMIEKQQMSEMENELRKVVDDMMRVELQLLQEAFDKDKGIKGKKQKASKRGTKKAKKKKDKDLTPDRTTASLFEELVANGIIKKYPKVYLDDFKGERSYNNPVPFNKGVNPSISLGDFRQILTEYCVIPLLSDHIHQSTPQIKSILIAGAKGSGKDMLVHAVCTEIGAVLFDLTPANIVGKYPGKSGLIMLIHLISKVSRLLQPAIIYMDDAEKPFVKKIPKTDKTDPKRLKKDLIKIVKNFWPEDRVMLIGVSSCPWESDQKLLQQVYQKYLVIPRPDYSSRYCLWSYLLGQYSAIGWNFDTSGISRVSDGYAAGPIVKSVSEVMTIKRMVQLRVQTLSPFELINALARYTPIYKEEEEAMEVWHAKTIMCKRRLRAIEMLEQEILEFQAKQANAKK
ncbi:dynein regulatory complex protein 11 [Onthophagus taurus]|uniref:dynein regulatory complex protein 11 n=1 Tax=Onthophagus taurus TaxID=166361 RepID=UPI0039BE9A14